MKHSNRIFIYMLLHVFAADPAKPKEQGEVACARIVELPLSYERQRTLDAGLSARWATGDMVYGGHLPLREGLERRCQGYALTCVFASGFGDLWVSNGLCLCNGQSVEQEMIE
jgi:hypothetical protein